jgi:hypothetical protein
LQVAIHRGAEDQEVRRFAHRLRPAGSPTSRRGCRKTADTGEHARLGPASNGAAEEYEGAAIRNFFDLL